MIERDRARAPRTEMQAEERRAKESGFTLIETTIALVIMMVAGLAAAALFTFSVNNNSGGNDRAIANAIAQQQLETLRNANFAATSTSPLLTGGTVTQGVTAGSTNNPRRFNVVTTVDDNPATNAIDVVAGSTLKRISITVTPMSAGPAWATGANSGVTVWTLRSRIN